MFRKGSNLSQPHQEVYMGRPSAVVWAGEVRSIVYRSREGNKPYEVMMLAVRIGTKIMGMWGYFTPFADLATSLEYCSFYYSKATCHDDVIIWNHFPRYWPFVKGIHLSSVDSPHRGKWRGALIFLLICLNRRFSEYSRRRWFEMPPRPLWRHCNVCCVIRHLCWIFLFLLNFTPFHSRKWIWKCRQFRVVESEMCQKDPRLTKE